MRCLDRRASLSVASVVLALVYADSAAAGAWTQAPGEGLVIATAGRRAAPVGALAGGPANSDANISQVYLEYGLIEGLTVGAKVYAELSTSNFEASSATLGGFLRKRVWQDASGGVASVQAGYAHPVESLIGNGMELADPGAVPEAHLSGLYGRGWGGDWGSAFLSTGVGYQWRGDGLADELRGELTGGYAPWRRWMGMLSLYGLHPLAGGATASLKIAPSLAYTFWPKTGTETGTDAGDGETARPLTVQLGASLDLLNRDDGLGVSVSVWQRF